YGWSISERDDIELDLGRIAAGLGFGSSHVRNALAALAARGLIRYRNAFRGPGVRLVQDRVSELSLDRTELANRANRGQAKLRKIIEYCYSKGCLRRFVLDYFGDSKRIGRCATCSSCNPNSIAGLRPAQKTEKPGVLTLNNSGDTLTPDPP